MPYRPLQAPPNLDTDGLRSHGEDQYREIERAWTETDSSIATNAAAIAAHESAWIAYTPTVTGPGTATGRYKAIGKTVFVQVTITWTSTGAVLAVGLPLAASSGFEGSLIGRERITLGTTWIGMIVANAGFASVFDYKNANTANVGSVLSLSGVYEAA